MQSHCVYCLSCFFLFLFSPFLEHSRPDWTVFCFFLYVILCRGFVLLRRTQEFYGSIYLFYFFMFIAYCAIWWHRSCTLGVLQTSCSSCNCRLLCPTFFFPFSFIWSIHSPSLAKSALRIERFFKETLEELKAGKHRGPRTDGRTEAFEASLL